jgi:acetoin utilization deacetylase AcuC-like enzyme
MKVFWDPDCLLHNPPYEILDGDRHPYFESPARLQLIKKELEQYPSLFTFESASSSSESSLNPLDISRYVEMVHSQGYLRYLSNAYDNWVRSGRSTVRATATPLAGDKLFSLQLTFSRRTPCYLKYSPTQSCSLSQIRLRLSPSLPLLKQVRRYGASVLLSNF